MLDLSLFHIIPKAVHLEDFVSLQNQVMVVWSSRNIGKVAAERLTPTYRSTYTLWLGLWFTVTAHKVHRILGTRPRKSPKFSLGRLRAATKNCTTAESWPECYNIQFRR